MGHAKNTSAETFNEFLPEYAYLIDEKKGIQTIVDTQELDYFKSSLLNVGDLKSPTRPVEAISVIYDLEGFTNFTQQNNSRHMLPNFIDEFNDWLFETVKNSFIDEHEDGGTRLWAELPLYSKFLGDGVLFIWNVDMDSIIKIDQQQTPRQLYEHLQAFLCHIVSTMLDVCREYKVFYDTVHDRFVDVPKILRCGIARGNVFPIGGGRDYVGPSINTASRLQNLQGISFAFSGRGIDPQFFHQDYNGIFTQKLTSIKGIGDNELILVLSEEFDKLPDEIKSLYKSSKS